MWTVNPNRSPTTLLVGAIMGLLMSAPGAGSRQWTMWAGPLIHDHGQPRALDGRAEVHEYLLAAVERAFESPLVFS